MEPHWTAYLAALSTPILALFGAFIAYRQWRTSKSKLNLDLFEKRNTIYEAIRSLLAKVMRDGKLSHTDLQDFEVATRGARWLFDDRFSAYVKDTLHSRAIDLIFMSDEIAAQLTNEATNEDKAARQRLIRERGELMKWFYEQFAVLEERATPFMRIESSITRRIWDAIPVADFDAK